jgi:hypothetical protein
MIDPETTPRHVVLVGAGSTRVVPLVRDPVRGSDETDEAWALRLARCKELDPIQVEVRRLGRAANFAMLRAGDDRRVLVETVVRVIGLSVLDADGSVIDLGDPAVTAERRADLLDGCGLSLDVATRAIECQGIQAAERDF